MATRIPVDFHAEFRGLKPAGSFVKRDTGEKIAIPAKLKFEVQKDDGDVENVEISGTVLDRCSPPVDYGSFKRGDEFRCQGVAVIQERGADRDSFVAFESVVPAARPAAVKAA